MQKHALNHRKYPTRATNKRNLEIQNKKRETEETKRQDETDVEFPHRSCNTIYTGEHKIIFLEHTFVQRNRSSLISKLKIENCIINWEGARTVASESTV